MLLPPDVIDLQGAADELGIHYQTAYRWVRSGRLKANLVEGKYLVDRRDLAAAREERTTPRAPRTPSQERLERQAERMLVALRSGDESTAGSIARTLAAEGTATTELIQHVFVPAMRRIGDEWHEGTIPISVEHRASAITERILGELSPNPRGRRRGTAIVVAVEGERHGLPTSMAAVALREDNWNVHHLGSDLPPSEITDFCANHHVDLAVFSVTTLDVHDLVVETAEQIRALGIPTLIGSPGRTLDDLRREAREAKRSATQRRA